jgi:predicted transcriptional regulator
MKIAQPVLVDRDLTRQLMALSREVRQAREFHRLTVEELAHQADVAKGEIERVEAGEVGVPILSLVRVLRALDLSSQMLPGALLLIPTTSTRGETRVKQAVQPFERLAA